MPYPPAAPITGTVIQRIVDELMVRIDAMRDEDDARLWNNVLENAIGNIPSIAFPAVTLQQGNEETQHLLWPHIEKTVIFYIEFRFEQRMDVDAGDLFRYYLGKLQARLFGTTDNLTIGGLATNVIEVANAPEIESQGDPAPGGTLTFHVTYRHWQADPYHLPSENPTYAYGNN